MSRSLPRLRPVAQITDIATLRLSQRSLAFTYIIRAALSRIAASGSTSRSSWSRLEWTPATWTLLGVPLLGVLNATRVHSVLCRVDTDLKHYIVPQMLQKGNRMSLAAPFQLSNSPPRRSGRYPHLSASEAPPGSCTYILRAPQTHRDRISASLNPRVLSIL
ncbi:hypothetical protein BKA93DRAFT_346054 [Sparassis latifolia]